MTSSFPYLLISINFFFFFSNVLINSAFNSNLVKMRETTQDGVYDIHTNTMHYPADTQPTRARWEAVPYEGPVSKTETSRPSSSQQNNTAQVSATLIGEHDKLSAGVRPTPNGHEEAQVTTQSSAKPTTTSTPILSTTLTTPTTTTTTSIFPPVEPAYRQRFLVQDIYYETPPDSVLSMRAGPDPNLFNPETDELVPATNNDPTKFTMTPEVFNELPPECQAAYRETALRRREWQNRWKGETEDGARGELPHNYAWTS